MRDPRSDRCRRRRRRKRRPGRAAVPGRSVTSRRLAPNTHPDASTRNATPNSNSSSKMNSFQFYSKQMTIGDANLEEDVEVKSTFFADESGGAGSFRQVFIRIMDVRIRLGAIQRADRWPSLHPSNDYSYSIDSHLEETFKISRVKSEPSNLKESSKEAQRIFFFFLNTNPEYFTDPGQRNLSGLRKCKVVDVTVVRDWALGEPGTASVTVING